MKLCAALGLLMAACGGAPAPVAAPDPCADLDGGTAVVVSFAVGIGANGTNSNDTTGLSVRILGR